MNKRHFDKAIEEIRENLSAKSQTSFNEIKKVYGLGKYTAEAFKKALDDYGKPKDLVFEEQLEIIAEEIGTKNISDIIVKKSPRPRS